MSFLPSFLLLFLLFPIAHFEFLSCLSAEPIWRWDTHYILYTKAWLLLRSPPILSFFLRPQGGQRHTKTATLAVLLCAEVRSGAGEIPLFYRRKEKVSPCSERRKNPYSHPTAAEGEKNRKKCIVPRRIEIITNGGKVFFFLHRVSSSPISLRPCSSRYLKSYYAQGHRSQNTKHREYSRRRKSSSRAHGKEGGEGIS